MLLASDALSAAGFGHRRSIQRLEKGGTKCPYITGDDPPKPVEHWAGTFKSTPAKVRRVVNGKDKAVPIQEALRITGLDPWDFHARNRTRVKPDFQLRKKFLFLESRMRKIAVKRRETAKIQKRAARQLHVMMAGAQ